MVPVPCMNVFELHDNYCCSLQCYVHPWSLLSQSLLRSYIKDAIEYCKKHGLVKTFGSIIRIVEVIVHCIELVMLL